MVEIKLLCKRIDERFNLLGNDHNVNVNVHNIDMLPQLPMNVIEDINNFEGILISEEAQSQLVRIVSCLN